MWAGGRVRANGSLRCGQAATRRTSVLSVEEKKGRSGSLTFVVIQHQILQANRIVIDEQQDIVYRDAVPPAPAPAAAADQGPLVPATAGEWSIDTSPTLLFRFSALTYNGHRIHYDRDYARDAEGYPGLLVHGPLQALAMAEAARSGGNHRFFEYRLVAPLFDGRGMVVQAVPGEEPIRTAVRDLYGRPTASGALWSADPATS
jgi:3-methylfumaryl-CoA hydratase